MGSINPEAASAATARSIFEGHISARLDRLPVTPYLWSLVALVSFGAFFEIYDVALSGPLSLGLVKVGIFHTHGGVLGANDQATFMALTFAGLFLGTLGFSAIADRLGRRRIFTLALLWYAIATVIMGLQSNAAAVILWRFIAGVGVGLQLVAIDCYLSELMPKAVRGRAFAVSTAIQFLSVPVVAILAFMLLPHVVAGIAGWRWMAFVPGAGALLVWWVRRALPESPRWLAARGRDREADLVVKGIEIRVARQVGGILPPFERRHPEAPAEADAGFAEMWRPPYRRRTIMLIVFHIFQTIGFFGITNWLPTLLVSQGVTLTKTLAYGIVMALVFPIAPLAFSLIADRFERKWLIVIGALTAATFGLLLSRMTQGSNAVIFTLLGVMVATGNSLMSLAYHTYQSELYPTRIRARAVGFVYSFSRLSAIASTFVIAATLTRTGSTGVFILIGAAMLVVALTVGLFGPRTRDLSLEEISNA